MDVPGNACKVRQLIVGIDPVDGLVIVYHGDVGVVIICHGGGGEKRSEGMVRFVVRYGCVSVYVLLAFCDKADISAWILLNHDVVPILHKVMKKYKKRNKK